MLNFPPEPLPGGDPITSWVDLEPPLARALLQTQIFNRPLNAMRVRTLARMIKRGEYRVTHQGIALTWQDGEWGMSDGQHRCAAVIMADEGIRISITFGADVRGVDQGRPRSYSDTLRMAGTGNRNTESIVRAAWLWERRGSPPGRAPDLMPGPEDLERVLEAHPCIILTQSEVDKARKKTKFPASVAGWMRFATAHAGDGCDSVAADEWLEQITSGANLDDKSPALVLRERIMTDPHIRDHGQRYALAWICISAWNSWRKGDSRTIVKSPTAEQKAKGFPRVLP